MTAPVPSPASETDRPGREVRGRDLDRMSKSALLGIVAELARDRGVTWLIGGPRLWSKDELVNGILELEYPAPAGGAR